MKAEMYKPRAENKVFQLNYLKPGIKDKEPNELKKSENSKKINSEAQTEGSYTEKEANTNGKSGKEKYKIINCKYFSKDQGSKPGSYCWFSHEIKKSMERYRPYWWDGRCRYAADFCESGKNRDAANKQ